jgi:hypothetical protein
MGHKSIKTTMKYYVVSPEEFEQEAIKRLDGLCDTQADTPENGGLKEGAKSLEKIGGAEGDRTLGLMTASRFYRGSDNPMEIHLDRPCPRKTRIARR